MGGTHSPPLEITYNRSQLRNHWMFIFLAQCPGVKTILMVSCPRFPSSPVKAFIFNRYHPVPSSPIPHVRPSPRHPQKASLRHPCVQGTRSKWRWPVPLLQASCKPLCRCQHPCPGGSRGWTRKIIQKSTNPWKMLEDELDDFFLDIVPFKITEIRHRAATRNHGSDLSLIGCFRSRCKQLIPENLAKSSWKSRVPSKVPSKIGL
jgi:hypothetical protein